MTPPRPGGAPEARGSGDITGCRHLDFETKYIDCRLVTLPDGHQYWERGNTWLTYAGAPRCVQFCQLKGRINEHDRCWEAPGPFNCFEPSTGSEVSEGEAS